ncbi:hypothetical protein [Desulfovulcanus sp.]
MGRVLHCTGHLREIIEPSRVAIRDRKHYCGILLDDNARQPICRLYFNTKQKYIALLDDQKKEHKKTIKDLSEIYNFAEDLKATVQRYDNK